MRELERALGRAVKCCLLGMTWPLQHELTAAPCLHWACTGSALPAITSWKEAALLLPFLGQLSATEDQAGWGHCLQRCTHWQIQQAPKSISAPVVMKTALIKLSGFKTKQNDIVMGKELGWRNRSDLTEWKEGTRECTERMSRTLPSCVKLSQNIIKKILLT